MQSQQNNAMFLQAACEEVKGHTHQSFCLLFPAQTMGFLALADCSGTWAEDGHLACLLALQTLLDQVTPRLLDTSLMNDDSYFVLLKESVQQVHKVLSSAPRDYGACSLTAALLVGTNAYIVHAGTSRLYIHSAYLPLYQATRDSYLQANNRYRAILRMLGDGYQGDAKLDAMKLSLFQGDTLLLGTGSLWLRLPEAARDAALKQFSADPVQLCHQLITSADQEDNIFFNLILVRMDKADKVNEVTVAQLQSVQVIHMPEQIVLPKALQELQK